jgi:hypothetical protein
MIRAVVEESFPRDYLVNYKPLISYAPSPAFRALPIFVNLGHIKLSFRKFLK